MKSASGRQEVDEHDHRQPRRQGVAASAGGQEGQAEQTPAVQSIENTEREGDPRDDIGGNAFEKGEDKGDMAEEHEPDPHQNRMELAAGDLVVLEITEKKDEHVGDDGRTEDEEGHHGPGGIVNERGLPAGRLNQLGLPAERRRCRC